MNKEGLCVLVGFPSASFSQNSVITVLVMACNPNLIPADLFSPCYTSSSALSPNLVLPCSVLGLRFFT